MEFGSINPQGPPISSLMGLEDFVKIFQFLQHTYRALLTRQFHTHPLTTFVRNANVSIPESGVFFFWPLYSLSIHTGN